MLAVGDTAPAFTLNDQDGNEVSLSDFKGKKVFIWFYPKASTSGCTVEGCTLRDNVDNFTQKDIVILGISMDSVKRQKSFATKQNFPYKLLADTDGEVIKSDLTEDIIYTGITIFAKKEINRKVMDFDHLHWSSKSLLHL